ncbi:MAG TPA: chemotaxis protein CheW [Isosphaeraceae bacterium]|jgi:purine-binding chemotaxis protein CheW|nr:chemotaxis protein CheW [Isosphaeraceae bacterium]
MASSVGTHRPKAWCLFRSQSRALAVSLERVCEIVAIDRLVRVPLSPPELLGLCTVRREVIPVLRMDSEPSQGNAQTQRLNAVLVLRTSHQRSWGIAINRDGITVHDETVKEEDGKELEPETTIPPDVIRRGEDIYTVVHPENTWNGVRAAVESWYRISCPQEPPTTFEMAG